MCETLKRKGRSKKVTESNNKGMYPSVKGKRRKMAAMLTNPEFDGNISALCREMKVSRTTFYRWCDDSDFKNYVEYLIEKYTDSELPNAWRKLISKVNAGSVEAIKLFFEMKGKYKQEVNLNGGVVFISGEDDIPE